MGYHGILWASMGYAKFFCFGRLPPDRSKSPRCRGERFRAHKSLNSCPYDKQMRHDYVPVLFGTWRIGRTWDGPQKPRRTARRQEPRIHRQGRRERRVGAEKGWEMWGLRGDKERRKNIRARRSVSRVLSPPRRTGAGDDHSSGTPVTGRLVRPTRAAARKPACRTLAGAPPLRGLAPGGVYHAGPVAGTAVRSYRTLSPLPSLAEASEGGLLSVALSLGSPPPGITRHRVSMEPGLSSPRRSGRRPSDRLARLFSYACAAAASTRARSASSRATVSRSIRPSIRAGRKWRWNASTTLIVVRSRMPLSSTA